MDILGFGPDHVQVSLADKNGNMQAPTNWYSGFTKNNGGWQEDKFPRLLGDVNGDGLPDIVGFGEAGVYVALNDGKKFVDAGTWSRAMTYNLEWRTDNHPRHLADWNGDGMMDLVGFGYNGVEVHLSTGKTFTQIVRQGDNNKFGSGNWQISEEPRIVQDINGDGMADIIGFQGDGNVVVALSTGMGMKTIDKWHTSTTFTDKTDWTGENNPRFLSDVNGDGLPDLVGYGNHEMFVVINSGGDAGMGVGPDNLYKITDGYGDPITVEYATVPHGTKGLRKSGRYQHHGSAPKWPHVRVKSSSAPIVKSTTVRNSNTNDGTAKEVVTDYSWFNFTINKNGLGSEGFGKVQSVNRETGSKLIKEYYLSFPLSNYQSKRRLYDGDNNLLSQEDFQYTSLKGTWEKANLFERKPSYVGTWNGANARNQRYTLYDDNGLPYVIKDQGSNTGDAHIYRCRKHRVNTNLWIIDFVTEERVMRYDPTSGYGCRFGQGFNDGIDLQLTKTSEWYGFPRIQQEWDNIGKRWNRTDYHYGSSGETERVVDPNGNSTYYGYDRGRDGHMVTNRIQNALGHVIHKSYHWSGGVETQSFSNGKENTFHYDNFGRMTKAFGPHPTEGHQVLMKKILYEHPGGGKGVLKLTNFVRKDWGGDPNEINTNFHTGIFTSEYLDNLGNKIREEKNLLGDGQNQVSESIYNSVGQTTREYVPYLRGNSRGKYRQLHFAKGSPNLTKIVDHTGHVTKIRYGSGGMETWQTVPSPSGDGETTVYMKKSLKGNTLTKITPAGITNFTYDGIGNLKQIQDPTGARNYVYYNSVGSVYKQSRPDTGTERMWYDTNGNLTKKQNGAGEVTTISYDKLNRIVRSQNSVGFQAYTYDNGHPNAKGRLTKIRYPGNNYEEFTYDNTGKTVVSKVTIEGTSFVSKTEYGPQGGVDRYTFPNGKVQNNNHRRGYIKSVDFDGSRMATVNSINVNGSATETELGNGDVISQRYDSFFRMLGTSVRNGGRLQFSESIAYDNRTGKVIFVSRGDLGVKGFYKYDNLGRLNNARYAKGSIWNQKNISHESYTFDRNYNLTSVNNTQFNLVNNQVRSVSGDKSINYSYDRAGRMTHKSKGGFSQSFGYDPTSSKLNYIKTNGKETKFFFAGDGRTLRRLDHDGRSVVSPFGSFEVATHKNGSVTHTMRVFGFGKVIAAITEDGQPSLVNRHIIHNTYKLSAGMMDTNTLIGAYGWAKNKFAQLLSRPDLANELLKGFSLAFAVGVLFFMIYGIVRTRLRGKVHWWHYPVLVVFFTVSMTVPVFAGIQPGANGAGQPTIGTLYFHTDHLGSTGATTDENGNSKSKVLYNSYGEVVEEHSSGKDNFREKFLGKEYDKGTGLTYMGARAFDNDIRRFISPDPAHQMESPYRYAADPIAKADPNGNFIFTLIAIIVGALITGFVLAGSIAGTFNPLKWDAKVWGYFFAGAIVGALFGAFAAWAAPAAIASAGVASGSWAAFGITAAITFGVGIAQAMVIGAIKQGGLIDTGKQDSFNVHDWGMGVLMEGVVAGAAGIGVGALFKGAGQGFSAAWKAIKKVAVPGRSGWLGKAVGFVTKVGNSKAWNKLQAFTGQMSAKTAKAQDNLAAFNKIADGAGFTQAMASKTMQNIRLAGKITRATWSVVGVSVKVGCGYTGGCSNSRGWAMGFVGGFLGGSSGFGMVMENLIQAGVGAASHAATGGHCGTFAGNMTSMNAGAMCDY
jgi:RHS repeat-associated protein